MSWKPVNLCTGSPKPRPQPPLIYIPENGRQFLFGSFSIASQQPIDYAVSATASGDSCWRWMITNSRILELLESRRSRRHANRFGEARSHHLPGKCCLPMQVSTGMSKTSTENDRTITSGLLPCCLQRRPSCNPDKGHRFCHVHENRPRRHGASS